MNDANIIVDNSPEEFLQAASPLLEKEEAINNLMLGVSASMVKTRMVDEPPPLFMRLVENGVTVTAAIQATGLRNLILTFTSDAQLELICWYLLEKAVMIPGVVGPQDVAERFVAKWTAQTGKRGTLAMKQMMYKLTEVKLPGGLGKLRKAGLSDLEIVSQWLFEFRNESLPMNERKTLEECKEQVERSIGKELVYVWEVDESLCSMAFVGRATKNGISVSGVYTPKHLRKQGYASLVVAYLSQKMLDSGKKFCVLYTDLANPTSNKIYQNVGYREICESKYYLIDP